MKIVKLLCVLLLSTLMLTSATSCKSVKLPLASEINERIVIEKIHDTTFIVEADSSSIKALIECIEGKPRIKEIVEIESGKVLKPPKIKLVDDVLSVDCEKSAEELFLTWKEKYVQENRSKTIPVEVEKQLTWLQQTQIYAGKVLFVLILLMLFYWLLKKQLNAFGLKK